MMEKKNRIIYLVSTGLISALLMMSAMMYFFKHEMVVETFEKLGFPTYIIYPLAIAKILGVMTIWYNKAKTLKEWAYAGIVFNVLLALSSHVNAGDGESMGAIIAFVLIMVSYFSYRKMDAAS